MAEKTELQRDILITAYNNRRLSQAEIADRVGCSASYVSNVLNRFDNVDAMYAEIEQLNQNLGFEATSGLENNWGFDANPDWHQGDDFDADLDQAIRDGVEGLKVLSKKTKRLIEKLRD